MDRPHGYLRCSATASKPGRWPGAGAFTLVELLVVIAVVATLAGMLLPAVATLKEASRLTVCLGKQRQIGLAFGFYAADWNGAILHFRRIGTAETTWPVLLHAGEYLDDRNQASCPSWGRPNILCQYNGYGVRWETPGVWTDLDPGPDLYRALPIRRMNRTSELPLMADTCGTNTAYALTYQQQFVSWYKASGSGGLGEGMVHFRHRNRVGALFADFHTEGADRSRIAGLLTTEYANPSLEIWAADSLGKAFRLN